MKGRGKEKVQTKSAGARFTDMRTEQDVASPAAAVLERRQSRTTQQRRKQESSAAKAKARGPRARRGRRAPRLRGPTREGLGEGRG